MRTTERRRRSAGGGALPAGPVALAAVTLLGLVLRLHRAGSDLWLDEISALLMYGDLGPLEVLRSYPRPNNHVLNTLLVNASAELFGAREWAIRLPAILCGAATVPALYDAGRRALARWTALAAALLLAVSYHHVFYSQNARGYAAYLLFSVLAAGLLPRVLDGDRWAAAGYAAVLALDLAALPLAAAVLPTHAAVAAVALVVRRRRGGEVRGAAPVAVALAVPAIAGALLYGPLLGSMLAAVGGSYRGEDRIGFSFASWETVREVAGNLAAGLGVGLLALALPVLALMAAGVAALARRAPVLVAALALPPVLTAAGLLVTGASFYPRFFLLLLPLALLATAEAIRWTAARASARRPALERPARWALLGTVVLLSAASLALYYRAPKQSYRAAAAHVAEHCPERTLIVDVATGGFRFYGPRFGLEPGRDLVFVRSPERLEAELAARGDEDLCLVTTFHDALDDRFPGLLAELRTGWRRAERFPATVRGGEIRIWRRGGAG